MTKVKSKKQSEYKWIITKKGTKLRVLKKEYEIKLKQVKGCEYCDSNTRYFHCLNQTLEYSGIDIALSPLGILRCRVDFGTGDGLQDIVRINYCPMCGRKLT